MHIRLGAILLVCVLTLGFTTPTISANNIEAKVDEYLNTYLEIGTFNGSVLLAKEGQILLAKGYGMANYELSVANSPITKFRIGSVTKQFTAIAILKLQEQGLLSVKDPLAKYLPDYPRGEEITLHHLLTHTSGIHNFTSDPEYIQQIALPSTLVETIARFKDLPLEFKPGTDYQYSNSNYILLGYIIEEVSGGTYEEFLRQNILEPLGMADTGYDRHETLLPNRASGYILGPDGFLNAWYIDTSIPHGAGALYSTVYDLYRLDQALFNQELLSQDSLEEMFTPDKAGYGYAWNIGPLFGRKSAFHGGAINGFTAFNLRLLEEGTAVIVLANVEGAPVSQIAKDLTAIILGEEYQIPKIRQAAEINTNLLLNYVGRYQLAPDFFLEVTVHDGRLFLQDTDQQAIEFFPESPRKFFAKVMEAEISFTADDEGKTNGLVLFQHGREFPAPKVD